MAFIQMSFFSGVLGMSVPVNVILPEKIRNISEKNIKTLYLLHGLTDDHTAWVRQTSIERYANEYGIAVVMPEVHRSWYTDTADGARYLSYIAEELPQACRGFFRGLSTRREDNFIAGLSMGGYGAMKIAIRYPDTFGGCAALSGALDISDLARKFNLCEWRGIFGFDLQSASQLKGSRHDLFKLVRVHSANDGLFPEIYLWCGERDRLIECNDRMHELLSELGIDHLYEHSEGNHSWKWWDLHIQDALRYLLSK